MMVNGFADFPGAPWLPEGLQGAWAFIYAAVFLYGIVFGSFLNVCIWRMPRGESVVLVPSHCTSCGAKISWFDNLPLLSFLVLRGRCRHCRAPYSPRYFLVELLTGLLFVAVTCRAASSGLPPAVLFPYFVMILLAVAAAWIDAEHRIIPDALTFPAMALALAAALLAPGLWGTGRTGAVILMLLSGALPAGLLWLAGCLTRFLVKREAIGLGDVKFTLAGGMLLGLGGGVFMLTFGSLAATLWGVAFCLCRRKRLRGFKLAFGPFLAAGALVWMLAAPDLPRWYAALTALR